MDNIAVMDALSGVAGGIAAEKLVKDAIDWENYMAMALAAAAGYFHRQVLPFNMHGYVGAIGLGAAAWYLAEKAGLFAKKV